LGVLPSIPIKNHASLSNSAGRSFDIPSDLQHNFAIQECSYIAIRILFGSNESSLVLPPPETFYFKMDTIEEKFKSLRQSLDKDLSFMNSLRLPFALLYFQSMYFLVESTPGSGDDGRRRDGILRAYQTATSIITTTISHDSAHEELLYAPAATSRTILYAALIIFRVLHSNYATPNTAQSLPSSQQLDRNAGNLLYNSACLAIRRCAIQRDDKDFPTRMADMLKEIWRAGEKDDEFRNQEPTCKVKSRMGAGLVFDCLRIWRDYNNNSNAAQSSTQSELWNVGSSEQQQQQPQLQLDSQLLPPRSLSQQVLLAEPVDEFSLSVQGSLFGFRNGSWGGILDSDVDFSGEFDQKAMEDWGLYGLI
jgi:hypothetical protein